MLPFALKIAVFCLSISGTLCSAVVLVAFAKAIDVYWPSASYGIANFFLQAIVCLGLIWKMNPFLMPHWFCLTQTIVISCGSFVMTGVCTSFSVATALAVFRPSKIRDFSTLGWRNIYLLFMVLFPAIAASVQITVIFKLNAVRPTDDLHCDASHPIWVRFLGYAGVSLLLCIPSFVLSALAAWKLWKTPRLTASRSGASTFPSISFRSTRGVEVGVGTLSRIDDLSSSPNARFATTDYGGAKSDSSYSPRYHLPFEAYISPPKESHAPISVSMFQSPPVIKLESPPQRSDIVTPGPVDETDLYSPGYAPRKSAEASHNDTEYESAVSEGEVATSPECSPRISISSSSSKVNDFPADGTEPKSQLDADSVQLQILSPKPSSQPLTSHYSVQVATQTTRSSEGSFRFGPAVWRLLFFQIAFFFIECLAALSTIIDVATRRATPTPFGTQHVALILAAWGPFVVFVHLPAVRRVLLGWIGRRN